MGLGYSQAVIAQRVGVSQPTIFRASKGRAILYDAGKAIEKMHAELVKESTDKAA